MPKCIMSKSSKKIFRRPSPKRFFNCSMRFLVQLEVIEEPHTKQNDTIENKIEIKEVIRAIN